MKIKEKYLLLINIIEIILSYNKLLNDCTYLLVYY